MSKLAVTSPFAHVATAALLACVMLSAATRTDAATVELALSLDARHGFGFTFGSDWFFQTAPESFDTITLRNGDTLVIDFSFVGGSGLTITSSPTSSEQIEFQLFGPQDTGLVDSTTRLDILQHEGDLTGATFFDSVMSNGTFIACICNSDITESEYTLLAGRLTTTIVSGMETPFDFDLLKLQVSSGQPVVVSPVPVPAGVWLLLSAIGCARVARPRRKSRGTHVPVSERYCGSVRLYTVPHSMKAGIQSKPPP